MKRMCAALLAASFAISAHGQPMTPKKPEMKTPSDPGMRKTPQDSGAVIVPPATGTEDMAKKPANVDSKMDDATPDIDRKNRKKSEDKSKTR